MSRISALLISTALFSPLGYAAGTDVEAIARQSSAPPWVNVAALGKKDDLNALREVTADISFEEVVSEVAKADDEVVYWEFPEPELPPPSIWPRIREGFAFPTVKSRRVGQFERWYKRTRNTSSA